MPNNISSPDRSVPLRDPRELTTTIDQFQIKDNSDLSQFFDLIQNVSLNPWNSAALAKRLHDASTLGLRLDPYQSIIEKKVSSLCQSEEPLEKGHLAQLIGSAFPFCTTSSKVHRTFLRLLNINVRSFSDKELFMALEGVRKHPSASGFVFPLFNRIISNPSCDLLASLTLTAGKLNVSRLAEQLESEIARRVEQFSTPRLIDVVEGVGHYARQSVFFSEETLSRLIDDLLKQLMVCKDQKLVQKGVLIGSKCLAFFNVDHSKWRDFCLRNFHTLPIWDRVEILHRLIPSKGSIPEGFEVCLIQLVKEYLETTPRFRLKKYPGDGVMLAYAIARYCRTEKELFQKVIDFVFPHLRNHSDRELLRRAINLFRHGHGGH